MRTVKHITLTMLALLIAACQHKPNPLRSRCAIGSCNTNQIGLCSCENEAAGRCCCPDGESLPSGPSWPSQP